MSKLQLFPLEVLPLSSQFSFFIRQIMKYTCSLQIYFLPKKKTHRERSTRRLPYTYIICASRTYFILNHNLRYENRHPRRSTGNRNTQSHRRKRPTYIRQKHHHANRRLAPQLRLILNKPHEGIEVLGYDDARRQSQWSYDVVEDVKASVYREEGLPLSRCQWAESRLMYI